VIRASQGRPAELRGGGLRLVASGWGRERSPFSRALHRLAGVSELPIRYPDTSGWEDWQLEYRYGGIYLFPSEGIIEDVDRLREHHDPASHEICQAHVSLSEPEK